MKVPAAVPTELSEQIALVRALRMARLDLFAVPNGGRRGRQEAISLKASGMTAGVPDLLIITPPPGGKYVATALELKRSNGRPSDVRPEQRAWLEIFARHGWAALVCYGAADALVALRGLGYRV